jgi:tRNA(His) guanylyltransferase
MDPDRFDKQMRSYEYFHTLRLIPGTWTVIRVDGRSFSRFTEGRFDKPFDIRFRDMMIEAAGLLMEEMNGIYAYIVSDEISVLFAPAWDLFNRELEKLVSISASIASAAFTHASGEIVQFDSRIWIGVDKERVVDYFRWRQADAARCALNSWAYRILRNSGMDVGEATAALKNRTVAYKNELLFRHGINFNDLPAWQRRGVGLYWETYEKEGFNPVLGRKVTAVRRRVKADEYLPMKDAYGEFIRGLIAESA